MLIKHFKSALRLLVEVVCMLPSIFDDLLHFAILSIIITKCCKLLPLEL